MTDEGTTTPDNSPFRSLGEGGGMLAVIAAGAAFIWAMFAGRIAKEDAREHDRERAAHDQLELLQKMRDVERREELHRAMVRSLDETTRTQMDQQDAQKQERLVYEAQRRVANLEEAYWRAKLAPASFTGKDALALARAIFEARVLEGSPRDSEQAFGQFIEDLTRKLEET
jgi:hypothetical protein